MSFFQNITDAGKINPLSSLSKQLLQPPFNSNNIDPINATSNYQQEINHPINNIQTSNFTNSIQFYNQSPNYNYINSPTNTNPFIVTQPVFSPVNISGYNYNNSQTSFNILATNALQEQKLMDATFASLNNNTLNIPVNTFPSQQDLITSNSNINIEHNTPPIKINNSISLNSEMRKQIDIFKANMSLTHKINIRRRNKSIKWQL